VIKMDRELKNAMKSLLTKENWERFVETYGEDEDLVIYCYTSIISTLTEIRKS